VVTAEIIRLFRTAEPEARSEIDLETAVDSVTIPALRATYLDLARQWRSLAKCLGRFRVAGEHDIPTILN